jgi:hypothetical protein
MVDGRGTGDGSPFGCEKETVTVGYQRSPAASGTGEMSVPSAPLPSGTVFPDSYAHHIITAGKILSSVIASGEFP